MGPVRICTRPSTLAVVQAEMVARALEVNGLATEIIKVHSTGDKDQSSPLYGIGGNGIFVEEINKRVLEGGGDIAVHSAKDLPSELPGDLEILGVLPREEPNDVLISSFDFKHLPQGSKIGTSSIRRIHELKMLRNDLKIENLRGNLDTRIKKLQEGQYDGIILAKAGLKRLSSEVEYYDLNLDDFLPAPNQGIIAIVGKKQSEYLSEIGKISHPETFQEMLVERRLIGLLKLGCSLPAAILCRKEGVHYRLRARFYSGSTREFKEFSRTFSDIGEVDELAREIQEKVPSSYGFNFRGR